MKPALPWLFLIFTLGAVAVSLAWRFRPVDEFAPDIPDIRMEVVNGCGVPRAGKAVAEELMARGFNVYGLTNTDRHHARTAVIDLRDPLAGNAGKVARALTVRRSLLRYPVGRPCRPEVRAAIDSTPFLEVRLVVGDDYRRFFPKALPLR